MRLVLLLSCLLGLSLGADLEKKPKPCKSPPLLSGGLSYATQSEEAWFYAPYEYDSLLERIRFSEVGSNHSQSFTYNALLLYKEGVMYEINSTALTCIKKPLKTEFQPWEVPSNASLLLQYVIGSSSGPGEGLLVNTWGGLDPDGAKYMMTTTVFGCVPTTHVYQTKQFGWVVFSFINNVKGIVDPNALNPPSFCPDPESEPEGTPVDVFTVIDDMRKNARARDKN